MHPNEKKHCFRMEACCFQIEKNTFCFPIEKKTFCLRIEKTILLPNPEKKTYFASKWKLIILNITYFSLKNVHKKCLHMQLPFEKKAVFHIHHTISHFSIFFSPSKARTRIFFRFFMLTLMCNKWAKSRWKVICGGAKRGGGWGKKKNFLAYEKNHFRDISFP